MKYPIHSDVKTLFSVFFVNKDTEEVKQMEAQLSHHFPDLELRGSASTISSAQEMVQKACPDIIFFDLDLWKDFRFTPGQYCSKLDFEMIILSHAEVRLIETIQNAITGYLVKPVRDEMLVRVVQHALQRIQEKEELRQNRKFMRSIVQKRLQETPIGIPTIEGFEFLVVNEILRCEGLQKYTRVVTRGKTNIVSSYNLGEFRSLLEPYGFFSPHRCHLVNLRHIKRYHKEGSIYMEDGICVPVAKRMKKAFLTLISRL